MSITIQYEVRLLAASLVLGVFLMITYDGLRVFRLLIRHGTLWTGVEDAFYWIGAGILTFLLLFEQNDGILRSYAIIAVLTGMLLYNVSVSRFLLSLLKKIKKYLTMKRTIRLEKRRRRKSAREQRKIRRTQSRIPSGNRRQDDREN